MNNGGASNTVEPGENRDERGRLMPVRIHELLGTGSKSASKQKNADGSMVERPQPMRIKDLLASMSSCKKPKPSARRMTTMPGAMSNVRRQLYEGTSGRCSPDKTFSIDAKTVAGVNNNAEKRERRLPVRIHELIGDEPKSAARPKNADGSRVAQPKSQPMRIDELLASMSSCKKPNPAARTKSVAAPRLGISRSEGKNMKTNGGERRRPEREKDLMASWEKSQTVKQQARKSMAPDLRAKNVRRKLYESNVPSPVVGSKSARNPPAPPKIQGHPSKSPKPERKSVKAEPKKSLGRKSCLLPPNAIRNRHVNRRKNSTIQEESPVSSSEIPSTKIISESSKNSTKIVENPTNSLENSANSSSIVDEENSRTANESPERSFDSKEAPEATKRCSALERPSGKSSSEVNAATRPTVIITAASERKTRSRKSAPTSPRSSGSDKSSLTMSRPATQLESSLTELRLRAMTSSFDDLRGEPSRERNLPFNSFLDEAPSTSDDSFARVDRRTIDWMHANLSIAIRSTEENLFAMKQMLRTIDELRRKNSHDETSSRARNSEAEATSREANVEKIGIDKSAPKINVQRESCEEAEIAEGKFLEASDENKENIGDEEKVETVERRRSARLSSLERGKSPKNSDDSFAMMEKELNIHHEKSTDPKPRIDTPRERRKVDTRNRRSMREYMALKSVTNFLQTPDVKGMPTPRSEKDTPSHRLANKRALSRQLLIELDDLYAESPQ